MNITKASVFGGVLLCSLSTCFGIPTLQLDVNPGTYNSSDSTTYSTSSHFDLIALLNGTLDPSRTYYISAALEPAGAQQSPPPNGSFKLGNTIYSVANMAYGAPPLGASKTISPHDEFPTYFTEYAFNFDALHTVPAYDVQTGATGAGNLYSFDLSVDTSPLLAGYSLHFDLYDIKTNRDGSIQIDDIAPFSHDAQSGTGTNTNQVNNVPDNGATWLLMGVALCGLAFVPKVRIARVKACR